MAILLPFRGLLPTPENAAAVAAVPYDVVSREEAAEQALGNPLSFLRVARPEIELPSTVLPYSDEVYEKALSNFLRLCGAAPLLQDQAPSLYIYSLRMGSHVQTGVVGVASTEDYDNGVIKRHERTRHEKEDDRTRHLIKLRAHTGPVFLTYRDMPEIDTEVSLASSGKPLFDFTASDGISHKLWRVEGMCAEKLSSMFGFLPALYIADGHHRAASASRAAGHFRSANKNHDGTEDYNFFLAVAFPASQLKILSYNRVVCDLNGLSSDELLDKISANFAITRNAGPNPDASCDIRMLLDGIWLRLEPLFDTTVLDSVRRLDVSILQDNILAPLLGIKDPRTSDRIDFIGGIRGSSELEKLLSGGRARVAFSMFPTTVEQLMGIADAGEMMPPKSTWFEPKLRDGLVCHMF
ncbi:MAG: DUF1015 domain-containing protein [Victivallales bacterium]|nr:DUF1015 domain-containing protein [Victivallales bacterium]